MRTKNLATFDESKHGDELLQELYEAACASYFARSDGKTAPIFELNRLLNGIRFEPEVHGANMERGVCGMPSDVDGSPSGREFCIVIDGVLYTFRNRRHGNNRYVVEMRSSV